jgi:hypothetical protein
MTHRREQCFGCDREVPAGSTAADGGVVMWLVGALGIWLVLALLVGVVIGRGTRLADERAVGTGVDAVLTPAAVFAGR